MVYDPVIFLFLFIMEYVFMLKTNYSMKTKPIILAATLIVAIVAIFLLAPTKATSQGKAEKAGIPADVNKIFENSCTACHANGGNPMAMSHVNFSHWDEYTAEKQAKKALDIEKIVSKGSMPPKSFKASHPDAVPTPEQIKKISAWADNLQPKK
jgi:cytochrome c5